MATQPKTALFYEVSLIAKNTSLNSSTYISEVKSKFLSHLTTILNLLYKISPLPTRRCILTRSEKLGPYTNFVFVSPPHVVYRISVNDQPPYMATATFLHSGSFGNAVWNTYVEVINIVWKDLHYLLQGIIYSANENPRAIISFDCHL